jgi:glucose-1-phosphate adenylyltransferase
MPSDDENGVATIGAGITIGDNAKIGPKAMINKNVEGGEEQC